ncbi:SDR family NAD(P)-dependent oxidoreductase [Actinacidiphila sp. bgisy167]|uniref:SDR family NAD(P)-dependent oxidoreductase n=1 Tax=Actinacidiphila sp. bgisy167 TaxID=3413797 RepID=UPI003D71F775
MDYQLTNRRALVTGSSSGLGAATAKLLATEGATVVVQGRNEERTHAVAEAIRAAGGRAEVAIGDLATNAGADAVAEAALAGGPIDILVNNAGFYRHVSWTDATEEDWRETYEVNVVSGVRMIKRLVPQMRERGWGRVIQIGGGLAIKPMPGHPHYNATLAARHNLAVSLARELKGTGVTSNVVAPGAILVDAVKDGDRSRSRLGRDVGAGRARCRPGSHTQRPGPVGPSRGGRGRGPLPGGAALRLRQRSHPACGRWPDQQPLIDEARPPPRQKAPSTQADTRAATIRVTRPRPTPARTGAHRGRGRFEHAHARDVPAQGPPPGRQLTAAAWAGLRTGSPGPAFV